MRESQMVLSTRLAAEPSSTTAETVLVDELRATFWTKLIVPPTTHPAGQPAQAHIHLLFFDGGSSGASETSAAAAVLIRAAKASGDASIIWATSAVLTTAGVISHQVAYKGLAAGLQAVRERNLTQLEVIGHSTVLIRNFAIIALLDLPRYATSSCTRANSLTSLKSQRGPHILGPTTRWRGNWSSSAKLRRSHPHHHPPLPNRHCRLVDFAAQ